MKIQLNGNLNKTYISETKNSIISFLKKWHKKHRFLFKFRSNFKARTTLIEINFRRRSKVKLYG